MIKDTPHLNSPINKREMTMQEKLIKDIGRKYNIPIHIVSMESNEYNKVERKQELIEKIDKIKNK